MIDMRFGFSSGIERADPFPDGFAGRNAQNLACPLAAGSHEAVGIRGKDGIQRCLLQLAAHIADDAQTSVEPLREPPRGQHFLHRPRSISPIGGRPKFEFAGGVPFRPAMGFKADNVRAQKFTGKSAAVAFERPTDGPAADSILLQMVLDFKGVQPFTLYVNLSRAPVGFKYIQPRLGHPFQVV